MQKKTSVKENWELVLHTCEEENMKNELKPCDKEKWPIDLTVLNFNPKSDCYQVSQFITWVGVEGGDGHQVDNLVC